MEVPLTKQDWEMVKKTSEDMIKNSSLTIETAKLSLSLAIEKIAEFPEDAE